MYPNQGVVHNFELGVIFSWLTLLHSIQYIFIATDAFHVKLRIYSRAFKIKKIYIIEEPAQNAICVCSAKK